jgi:phospholipid/cholesterol/gamma-HCH transport system ATP-binding protein
MSRQPAIHIAQLHKSFRHKPVLKGIDLKVMPGESLVIIGGSGSGKSVLLKTIIGLIKADKGSLFVQGKDMSKSSELERQEAMLNYGVLFQGGALFDSLTVWENVTFALQQQGKITPHEAKAIALIKLSSVGLGMEVADLYPSELSGGMQKRVALARAICTNPKIIFFDEPTTGLDPIMADVINNLIVQCSKELGATTVTITHDMASVRKIATNIAMIYQGKIIWHGTVDELDHSQNPYVDQFIHGRADGPIHMDYNGKDNSST